VARSDPRQIFAHQIEHLVCLCLLLAGLYGLSRSDGFLDGQLLGLGTGSWVALAVANAIAHQVFVWFCWRTELYGALLTRWFGAAAFRIYVVLFAVLILCRPLLVTAVAISNVGSFDASRALMLSLAGVCTVLAMYLGFSVQRYFGFLRAFGVDHFDPRYRTIPLVRSGIFRWVSNPMYVFGLLLLWVPGLVAQSSAALGVALFSHAYIWAHYFFTERPDMREIYG
jgi:protein-S-isoprenylcysteine O-methyltransferase Ste14